MSDTEKICPVEEIYHVPGSLNIDDLATRPGVKLADLGPNSIWQQGPNFLRLRRDLWPITRDFVRTQLLDEEVKSKQIALYASISLTVNPDLNPKLCITIQSVLQYSNSIDKVKSILARVLRGWNDGVNRKVIQNTPNAQ